MSMTTEEKLALIREVGEEIVTEEELRTLLEKGENLVCYDGFEPSGQMHIAQGLVKAVNVNKMTQAGFKFKMLVADWHAMANKKMGGDLEKIQIVGKYFIEVWKASGMDMENVEFVWASEMVKNPEYWKLVIQVGNTNALGRFVRTAEMMGREASMEDLTGANIIYSCMQVADIFMLDAKVAQLGMDQRKVNMLAREVGPQLGYWKPIVVSHHMLMGLAKPINPEQAQRVEGSPQNQSKLSRTIALKMSKSNPDSAIFMTDSPDEVDKKINKAYCPEGEVSENPILEYCRYIIFESLQTPAQSQGLPGGSRMDSPGVARFAIERPEKFGGTVILNSFQDLEEKFAAKQIHPQDLKVAVARQLNQLLNPVRRHFEENEEAKNLLEQVRSFQVTR